MCQGAGVLWKLCRKRRETGSRHQRGIEEWIYCQQLHRAWKDGAAIKPQKLSVRAEETEPWNLKGKIPGLRGAGIVLELGLGEAGPGQQDLVSQARGFSRKNMACRGRRGVS